MGPPTRGQLGAQVQRIGGAQTQSAEFISRSSSRMWRNSLLQTSPARGVALQLQLLMMTTTTTPRWPESTSATKGRWRFTSHVWPALGHDRHGFADRGRQNDRSVPRCRNPAPQQAKSPPQGDLVAAGRHRVAATRQRPSRPRAGASTTSRLTWVLYRSAEASGLLEPSRQQFAYSGCY